MKFFNLFMLAFPLIAQNSATFVKADTATQGKWQASYGSSGHIVATSSVIVSATLPAIVIPMNQLSWTWAYSTSDPKAIFTDATAWYNSAFSVDVQFKDTVQHQLAIYAVDWDSTARSEHIDVLDGTTGSVLSSQTLANFHNGTYLVWNVSGHVKLQFTSLTGANAVVSGIFFDPVPPAAPVNPIVTPVGTPSLTVPIGSNRCSFWAQTPASGYVVVACFAGVSLVYGSTQNLETSSMDGSWKFTNGMVTWQLTPGATVPAINYQITDGGTPKTGTF